MGWARRSVGSQGLDAGCGIGLQAMLLAAAIGPAGHVTGLDLAAAFLRYAEELVRESGLSGRISFQQGDVSRLPFDDNAFDWVWSADCVEDWAQYQRLCQPESPDFILNLPDYYAFFTYSMFRGKVP
jgi:ubiquinone/menaquinone biosynthesis C-methylase UbiE